MPALLTSTSMRPNSATVASTSARALVPVADVAAHRQRAPAQRPDLAGDHFARLELAAGDDHVGARLGEPQRHRPAQALAAAGDDDDLAGRVRGSGWSSTSPCRVAESARRRRGDAFDQVADVEVEQRVDLGRVDAARVAARSGPCAGRAAAARPRSRPRRSRRSPTSAAGTPAPRRRRRSRRAASPRRAAATPRRRRSRPGERMSRLSRAGAQPDAQLPGPARRVARPTARRRRPAARGRRAGGRRWRRPARPCCRSGCRAGPATRRGGPTRCACSPRRGPTRRKISTAAVTISSASRSKSAGFVVGLTAPSPACRRRRGRPCAAARRAARRTAPRRVTALRSRPSATSAGQLGVDRVELGPGVAAGEHADERGVGRPRGRASRSSATLPLANPTASSRPSRASAPAASSASRAADRVVDQVDAAACRSRRAAPGASGSVAVVARPRRRRARGRTRRARRRSRRR